jgi:hypothetical protein
MTRKWLAGMLLAFSAMAAEMPLPDLRIEPTAGGSIFYIRNNTAQPLKAYLIELVDYPGSSYSFWQDETNAEPLPPKGERRIQVTNMTVGAVPDYVKMRAALYADGSTAGVPEKVVQLMDRRRVMLETVRQVIARMESAQADTAKAGLKSWADTLQPQGKNRNTPAAMNQAAAHGIVLGAAHRLEGQSFADTLTLLRGWEKALQ